MDRLHQARDVILERQREDHELAAKLAERQTRALMAVVAGAASWKEGVAQANEWQLIPGPRSELDALPELDTVMGMFGGSGGMEFTPDEIPGLAEAFGDAV